MAEALGYRTLAGGEAEEIIEGHRRIMEILERNAGRIEMDDYKTLTEGLHVDVGWQPPDTFAERAPLLAIVLLADAAKALEVWEQIPNLEQAMAWRFAEAYGEYPMSPFYYKFTGSTRNALEELCYNYLYSGDNPLMMFDRLGQATETNALLRMAMSNSSPDNMYTFTRFVVEPIFSFPHSIDAPAIFIQEVDANLFRHLIYYDDPHLGVAWESPLVITMLRNALYSAPRVYRPEAPELFEAQTTVYLHVLAAAFAHTPRALLLENKTPERNIVPAHIEITLAALFVMVPENAEDLARSLEPPVAHFRERLARLFVDRVGYTILNEHSNEDVSLQRVVRKLVDDAAKDRDAPLRLPRFVADFIGTIGPKRARS